MNFLPRLGAVELRVYELLHATGETTISHLINSLKISEYHIRNAIELLAHKMVIDCCGDVVRVR